MHDDRTIANSVALGEVHMTRSCHRMKALGWCSKVSDDHSTGWRALTDL
jgi:hypothetical protein